MRGGEKRIIESMRIVEEDIQGHVVEVGLLKRDIGTVIEIGRGIEINVKEGIGTSMRAGIGTNIAVKTAININERNITLKRKRNIIIAKSIKITTTITMRKNTKRKTKYRMMNNT